MSREIKVTLQTEPIVKLECWALHCKYSYGKKGNCNCRLKDITIRMDGVCSEYAAMVADEVKPKDGD